MSAVAAPRAWPYFVCVLVALSLEVTPLPGGMTGWRPPWLALVVVYWAVAHPRRYGLGPAWLAGLVLDVLKGGILGQHALATAVAGWLALRFHQRLRLFPIWQQTVAVGAIIGVQQFLVFWVDGITGDAALSWQRAAPVLAAAIIWPLAAPLLDRLVGRLHTI